MKTLDRASTSTVNSRQKTIRKFLCLGTFILVFSTITAQNFKFEHIGIENGLSQVTVNDIYQDEFGRMWFATRDGLNNYDGNETKAYRPIPGDPTSLPKANIRMITGDNNGCLYLQTTSSVVAFDMKKEVFKEILKDGNGAIGKSKNGIWIGFKSDLYHYNPAKEELKLVTNLGYKTLEIFTVFETSNKVCLVGTNKGLISLDSNLTLKTYFTDSEIRDIYEDKYKNLWICSSNKGLILLKKDGSVKYFQHDERNAYSLINNFVRAVCEDNFGYIWVGSQFGLCRLDTKTELFQTYTSERENPWSLSSTSIMSLFKDKQGTVWAGTYFGGVNFINPERQTARYYYPSRNGLPHPVVGKFTEDKNGTVWLCTEGGGLASFDPKTGKFQSFPLRGSNLKEIYYDVNAHCLWIGTHITYLIRFDITTKKETVYESLPGTKEMYFGRNIMSIVPYGKNLILGTTLGVIVFDTKSQKVHHLMDSELKNGVTSMIIDSKNRLWVGTESNGVMCYDFNQKTLSQYRYRETGDNNLSSNYINIIFEDSKKQIWIGTRGYGLNLYQSKTNDFRVFTKEKNGIIDNNVVALAETINGKLLIGTNIGISICNEKCKKVTNYQSQNGFPLSTINERSLFGSKNGSIYVGGVTGMAVLTEKDFQYEKKPFDIFFNKLYVNNQEVKQGDETEILEETLPYTTEIKIKPNYSVFSIGFTTDNYIKTYTDDVQYRLKGYESKWLDARFGRMITYTNLSPGSYELEVRSKDFPDKVKSLSIIVLAPFYRTLLAYLLYLLAIGGLLFWAIKEVKTRFFLRTSLEFEKREKEKNEELIQSKLKFFTNISHEFRTPITLILGQTENLLQSHSIHPSSYKKILNIHKNASNLNGLINELLDFRKQEQGHLKLKISQINLVDFLKEVFVTFREYALNNNITFNFNRKNDNITLWIDVEQMHKVINNLLSNAFKFTPNGGNITISVEENNEDVVFAVTDTGQGILPDKIEYVFERFYQADSMGGIPGTGIGLALSKGIIEAHGGLIKVESEVSQGTTFKVILKKGEAHYAEDVIRLETKQEILNYDGKTLDSDFIEEIKQSQQEAGSEKLKLLIVEDNEDVRLLLSDIFAPIYEVEVAIDGVDGLNKVREFMPDIVISDIMMPRMSGIELCTKIKNNFDICHIPVVLLTAKTAVEHKFEGLRIGADDYITKPFDVKLLVIRCNNLVNSRKILQKKFIQQPEFSNQQIATTEIDREFITKATAIIEANIDNSEFNVDIFASEMALGRTTLFNKLRGITGLTPNNFISNIRLKKAAIMLANNMELNVSEIAYDLGFSSPRYFNKCFKDLFGCAPIEYRKNNIKH